MRQPPEAAKKEALKHPNGYVYFLDKEYERKQTAKTQ